MPPARRHQTSADIAETVAVISDRCVRRGDDFLDADQIALPGRMHVQHDDHGRRDIRAIADVIADLYFHGRHA